MTGKIDYCRIRNTKTVKYPIAKIRYKGTDPPDVGGVLNIYYPSGNGIFYGIIQNVDRVGKDVFNIEAKGHKFDLYRDFITDALYSFQNTTISGAIHNLINTYYDINDWFVDITGGDDTVTIEFDKGIFIGEAIDTLCKIGNLNYDVLKDDATGKNKLIVYPNESSVSKTFTDSNIGKKKMFGNSDRGFANYVIVQGGTGWNGESFSMGTDGSYLETASATLVKPEYSQIYSIEFPLSGATVSKVKIGMFPTQYNIAPDATIDGGWNTNVVDEDRSTYDESATFGYDETVDISLIWEDVKDIQKVFVDYLTSLDHEIEIYYASDGWRKYKTISKIGENYSRALQGFNINVMTSGIRVLWRNKTSGTNGYIRLHEIFAFTPGYTEGRCLLPERTTPLFTPKEEILNGYTNVTLTFPELLNVDTNSYYLLTINKISGAAYRVYYKNGVNSDYYKMKAWQSDTDIWYNYPTEAGLTHTIKWGGTIEVHASNQTSIDNIGRYVYVYKNRNIRDYDVAESLADKLLSVKISSQSEGQLEVPFKEAYDIKIGDKVKVYLPNYNISGQYYVYGYDHILNKKNMKSILYLGKEDYDPGVYLEMVKQRMNEAILK